MEQKIHFAIHLALVLLFFTHTILAGITLDVTDPTSIKQAAATIAYDLMTYYTGSTPGDVPGNLPQPYYWWEAGGMFGVMIDYYYFTGDSTWNNVTMQAMLHQVGPNNDFMPPNQSSTEGNDDQSFWGFAALSAAENGFPNPPADQPQWLALAQAVFNTQAVRWDNTTCGGGLRWQIYNFNAGYNYKNSISNGCFFATGARLAVYTGNQTYANWADRMWDWVTEIGLVDNDFNVFDGSDDTLNCTQLDHLQWTYTVGVYLLGAANMYNYTNGSSIWETRVNGLIGNIQSVFLKNGIVSEIQCEPQMNCDTDQRSFKAYLARWLAAAAIRAPFTYPVVKRILEDNAQAAVSTCVGGSDGTQCGLQWTSGSYDGSTGVGEQMSALEVVMSNLINVVPGPVTENEGGTSKGNPAAGGTSNIGPGDLYTETITTKDKVGASFMTLGIIGFFLGTAGFIVS